MRIGVIGPNAPDDFADNIVDSLPRIGHEAVPLGSARVWLRGRLTMRLATLSGQSLAVTKLVQRRVVERARSLDLDAVITIDGALLHETVAGLRATGAKVALWFPDSVGELYRELMLVAPYDAVFFEDRVLTERARKLRGVRAHYLAEACNSSWHRPGPRDHVDPAIVVPGTLYPARVRILDTLLEAGIPLRIYGGSAGRWIPDSPAVRLTPQPYVRREEKARVFRSAAAVLNTMKLATESVNNRLFEAAGCGAAVLCEYRPGLSEYFEPDSELLTFDTLDELVEKARRLLADPEYGTELGDAAAARAHAEHTYEHRLEELVSVLMEHP